MLGVVSGPGLVPIYTASLLWEGWWVKWAGGWLVFENCIVDASIFGVLDDVVLCCCGVSC